MADKTDPPTTADPAAGQPDGGQSTDTRLDRLEATQAEQGSKLDRILDLLPGKATTGGGDDGAAADGAAAAPDIQSQVRAEIAATKAREAEEARARGDADWRKSVEDQLEALRPEKTPREAQTGWRGRLQSAMFGRPE